MSNIETIPVTTVSTTAGAGGAGSQFTDFTDPSSATVSVDPSVAGGLTGVEITGGAVTTGGDNVCIQSSSLALRRSIDSRIVLAT